MFWFFCLMLFSIVDAPSKNCALTKAASIPAQRQSENTGLIGLIFDAAPHLEVFSQFSSSTLKLYLLNRHLTLSEHFVGMAHMTGALAEAFQIMKIRPTTTHHADSCGQT